MERKRYQSISESMWFGRMIPTEMETFVISEDGVWRCTMFDKIFLQASSVLSYDPVQMDVETFTACPYIAQRIIFKTFVNNRMFCDSVLRLKTSLAGWLVGWAAESLGLKAGALPCANWLS